MTIIENIFVTIYRSEKCIFNIEYIIYLIFEQCNPHNRYTMQKYHLYHKKYYNMNSIYYYYVILIKCLLKHKGTSDVRFCGIIIISNFYHSAYNRD